MRQILKAFFVCTILGASFSAMAGDSAASLMAKAAALRAQADAHEKAGDTAGAASLRKSAAAREAQAKSAGAPQSASDQRKQERERQKNDARQKQQTAQQKQNHANALLSQALTHAQHGDSEGGQELYKAATVRQTEADAAAEEARLAAREVRRQENLEKYCRSVNYRGSRCAALRPEPKVRVRKPNWR